MDEHPSHSPPQSYRTVALLADDLDVPVDDVAEAAVRMPQAGDEPYVRAAGEIIGWALRTERGWVLNAALTHEATTAIERHIQASARGSATRRAVRVGWSDEQSRAAFAEGWGIFETSADEVHPWRLQRIGDPDALAERPSLTWGSDADVWEHLSIRARQGSELHSHALEFLAACSPPEREEIDRWVAALPSTRQRHSARSNDVGRHPDNRAVDLD